MTFKILRFSDDTSEIEIYKQVISNTGDIKQYIINNKFNRCYQVEQQMVTECKHSTSF